MTSRQGKGQAGGRGTAVGGGGVEDEGCGSRLGEFNRLVHLNFE